MNDSSCPEGPGAAKRAERRHARRARIYDASRTPASQLPAEAVTFIEWVIEWDDDTVDGAVALLEATWSAGVHAGDDASRAWLGYNDEHGFYCRRCGFGITAPADAGQHENGCPVRAALEAAQTDGPTGPSS